MIAIIRKALLGTLFFIITIAGLLSFFLTTTPGLYTALKLSTIYIPGSLKVHKLKGRLIDDFSIGELEYQYKNTQITATNVTVHWLFKSLLHHQLPIDKLQADSVLIKSGTFINTLKQLELSGLISPQLLKLDTLHFNFLEQEVNANLNIYPDYPHSITGTIRLSSLMLRNKLTAKIDISGDIEQLLWAGEFQGAVRGTLTGSLKEQSKLYQLIKWRDLHWQLNSDKNFNSPEGRISITGVLPNIAMEITTKLNNTQDNEWRILANLNGTLPWKWKLDANLSQVNANPKRKGLHTNLLAKAVMQDKNNATLDIKINPGHYQMPDDSLLPAIEFKNGALNAVITPNGINGKGSLDLDSTTQLNLKFTAPNFKMHNALSGKQAVSAELSLALKSLEFLQDINPELTKPKGRLDASIKAQGSLNKLALETKISLKDGSCTIPALGLQLDSIDLNVRSKGQQWLADGFIRSADKKLVLKGQGPINKEFTGAINLEGDNFPVINTKEYQINTSPKLNLQFSPSLLHISGAIQVPFARIMPQRFTNSITLSDDVVYANNTQSKPSNFNTSMDIRVEAGNDVELTLKGLHASLKGAINIKQLPRGPINASGELTVKKGEYKAYGQDLAIDQGQLLFTGGSLDNPGVHLRASKNIKNESANLTTPNQIFNGNANALQTNTLDSNITVGVEVTGRLTAPRIQLFSNPAVLSQADILSMLVLGRPASQADKAGGQLLLTAISSMNLGTGSNGAQLLEQLKQNLGFDFNMQTNTNYNQATNQFTDSTAFVVGKTLSKRVYLSYNIGLSQADPNVMTIKYLLRKFISIQISTSVNASGIDILYTKSSKDKKHARAPSSP